MAMRFHMDCIGLVAGRSYGYEYEIGTMNILDGMFAVCGTCLVVRSMGIGIGCLVS